MKPPCEVVVREFLPLFRALVAKELQARGLSQPKIAKLIGVTQPAVNYYLRHKIKDNSLYSEDLLAFSRLLASGLVSGSLTNSESIKDICIFCTLSKCQGAVCTLHKRTFPSLQEESCNACIQIYSKGLQIADRKYTVLNNLRAAVDLIQASKEFAEVMPEVMVNIVEALPEAKSVRDVAGIPGRIAKVDGMPRSFMFPEFGASEHLASVLLSAMRVSSSILAAINIAYNRFVEEAFKRLGLRVYRFERREFLVNSEAAQMHVIDEIRKFAARGEAMPDVVVDRGGYGIEPSAYIFGASAVDVAKKAIGVAEVVARLKAKG